MKRNLCLVGIVLGVLLALGPLWGMTGTAFEMTRVFQELDRKPGITDPHVVSSNVSRTLLVTAAGLIACPIGVVLTLVSVIALVRLKRTPPPLPPDPTGRQ